MPPVNKTKKYGDNTMDPLITSSLISGGLGLTSSILGSSASAKSAHNAAKAQIAWERERATHAHQWEVQDLKAAGLNPILAAGGKGAVTGGISAPVPDTSGYSNAGNILAEMVNSALTAKDKQAEITLKGEQAANVAQDTLNKFAENGLTAARTQLTLAELGLIPFKKAKAEADSKIAQVQAEWARAQEIAKLTHQYATSAGAVIGMGGLGVAAIRRMAKDLNKVPKNNYYYHQGPWEGSYIEY